MSPNAMIRKNKKRRLTRREAIVNSGREVFEEVCKTCGEACYGASERNALTSLGLHKRKAHGYVSALNAHKRRFGCDEIKPDDMPDHLRRYSDGRTVDSGRLWALLQERVATNRNVA